MKEEQKIQAARSLSDKLELSPGKSLVEELSELSRRNQAREVISFYDSIQNAEEKFVLMEILVKVANERFQLKGQIAFWRMIEQRLVWDFDIHRQTVKEWAYSGTSDLDLSGPILQDMIELWDRSRQSKTRILFVCTINMMRSAAAHQIYSNDLRFEVRSAGTHQSARTVISRKLLDWAEVIIGMEDHHLRSIHKMYPEITSFKTITCLDIQDNYDYMQDELIMLLRARFEDFMENCLPLK